MERGTTRLQTSNLHYDLTSSLSAHISHQLYARPTGDGMNFTLPCFRVPSSFYVPSIASGFVNGERYPNVLHSALSIHAELLQLQAFMSDLNRTFQVKFCSLMSFSTASFCGVKLLRSIWVMDASSTAAWMDCKTYADDISREAERTKQPPVHRTPEVQV